MDLLASFLLFLGWVVGFLRALFFYLFYHCVFLCSRSFSFLFGLVDGCNFVSLFVWFKHPSMYLYSHFSFRLGSTYMLILTYCAHEIDSVLQFYE